MKNPVAIIICIVVFAMLIFGSCGENKNDLSKNFVTQYKIERVRLGDGVPLTILTTIRWQVTDKNIFSKQYVDVKSFEKAILLPRQKEIISQLSNTYNSVDSVFTSERESYIREIKRALTLKLGGKDASVNEVVVSEIIFPQSFTAAMEQVSLKERELELIQQRKIIAIENSKAEEEKATAEGKVLIAKAQSEGKVEQINAETEKQRRKNSLAKAQTQSEVDKIEAEAEVLRLKMIAKAEAEKKRMLMAVDIEEQKEKDRLIFDKEKELAKLCIENPAYANFLVNKEIASKVKIAVLPSGNDGGMVGKLFNSSLNE